MSTINNKRKKESHQEGVARIQKVTEQKISLLILWLNFSLLNKCDNKVIWNVEYSFPDSVVVTDHAKSLIKGILLQDPAMRLTIDEILDHPFFSGSG